MANLDTAAKRISGVNVGSPWRGLGYFPTGTVDAAERLAFAFLYSGIAASPPVTVPDVVGLTQADATTSITGVGLTVTVSTAYSSTVPAGTIISQSPAGGEEVASGSTVTITVSLGEAPVQAPSGSVTGFVKGARVRKPKKREFGDEFPISPTMQTQAFPTTATSQQVSQQRKSRAAHLLRLFMEL